MEILTVAVTGVLCVLCFVTGARVGQKSIKGENIELPDLNPFKAIRQREARKAAQAKQERLDKVLRNIERYDGTGRNQEDVE